MDVHAGKKPFASSRFSGSVGDKVHRLDPMWLWEVPERVESDAHLQALKGVLWEEVAQVFFLRCQPLADADAQKRACALQSITRYFHPEYNGLMKVAGKPLLDWEAWDTLVRRIAPTFSLPERPTIPKLGERRKPRYNTSYSPETAMRVIVTALPWVEDCKNMQELFARVAQQERLSADSVKHILYSFTTREERHYLACHLATQHKTNHKQGRIFLSRVMWPEIALLLPQRLPYFNYVMREAGARVGVTLDAVSTTFYPYATAEMWEEVRRYYPKVGGAAVKRLAAE
jgi:hypothetical protein